MQTYTETVKDYVEGSLFIEGHLIEPQINRITCKRQVIQIQPKIMQVLVCLAEEKGQVVTKEQLLHRVWADTHVTEYVLSRAISELRKVFGDNPKKPSVIETIPKVGYRLIAPVSKAEKCESEDSFSQAAQNVKADAPSRWSNRAIFGLVTVTGLMLFLAFMMAFSSFGHRFIHILTHRH